MSNAVTVSDRTKAILNGLKKRKGFTSYDATVRYIIMTSDVEEDKMAIIGKSDKEFSVEKMMEDNEDDVDETSIDFSNYDW